MIQKKPILEPQALKKLADLCAKGEHCSGEMLEKMRKWGLPEDARQRILNRLTAGKYIDDERFTRFFIHDKIRYNKWGRRKIEQALWQKQVPESVSRPLFDEVDDEEYLAVLRPLLKSKYSSINAATDYERSMKLIKFAMGRGFGLDLIRQCIDNADAADDGAITFDEDEDD